MTTLFNIEKFIAKKITGRKKSLLHEDLFDNKSELSAKIGGKSVLVIGGAGTIGSNFIKSLLVYKPGSLVVVDTNENGLTELVRDCRSCTGITLPANFRSYPINFGDAVFDKIFRQSAPFDIIANFAAHKHVRSEKDVFSIEAMIENNVLKAKRLLDSLLQSPPGHFFCVSTDKAANPVNVMGASKKLMEEIILAYSKSFPITTARFANVAFSNGSLLAGYLDRMIKRQPLSCPSDVKRFFVSPQESGEICLAACMLGESADIIFPRLETSVDMINFADITVSFLKEMGFDVNVCTSEEEARQKAVNLRSKSYPVYFFKSETSGEKLFEEFYTAEETVSFERFKALGVIKNASVRSRDELEKIIGEVNSLFKGAPKKGQVVDLLKIILPNFKHVETGVSLDQKM